MDVYKYTIQSNMASYACTIRAHPHASPPTNANLILFRGCTPRVPRATATASMATVPDPVRGKKTRVLVRHFLLVPCFVHQNL